MDNQTAQKLADQFTQNVHSGHNVWQSLWQVEVTLWQLRITSAEQTLLGYIGISQTAIPFINSSFFVVLVFGFLAYFISPLLHAMYRIRKQQDDDYTLLQVDFPRNTTQSTFSSEQLMINLHNLLRYSTWKEGFFRVKKQISLELVAIKGQGIRYIIRIPTDTEEIIARDIRSFLPGARITKVIDYLPSSEKELPKGYFWSSIVLKLSSHFAHPLTRHDKLDEHDNIGYISNHMTKLKEGEQMSMQVIISPLLTHTHKRANGIVNKLLTRIAREQEISSVLYYSKTKLLFKILLIILFLPVLVFLKLLEFVFSVLSQANDPRHVVVEHKETKAEKTLSEHEKELHGLVKEKLRKPLFETTIRLSFVMKNHDDLVKRLQGMLSVLSPLANHKQALLVKSNGLLGFFAQRTKYYYAYSFLQLKHRMPAHKKTPILSTSEIATLFHFPYTPTVVTEDLVKEYASELPAPLSLKGNQVLDVIFAKNTYGGDETLIGQTLEERRRHTYICGQTGSGKSTLLLSGIASDIKNGNGVGVIDLHGQLIEDVLTTIPRNRINDVINLNPDDFTEPIRINILEITPGLSEDDSEREKEVICKSVISLFRKVFSDAFTGTNPFRIEEVLQNAIYTAFTIPDCTLFTVYDLLEDPEFRTKVVSTLEDVRLKKYWKNVFGKAGDYQQFKFISPVTARIGSYLFSPSARRILEEPKSTINFDKIMDEGKILLCDLSRGKLSEDTSQLLGIMILNKLQLAALKRTRVKEDERRDFYLYVDEFQNFATPSFVKMLSEARKYHLNVYMAQQTTSQQADDTITNIILANAGTVICFKSASPDDEKRFLPQFAPLVKQGDLQNLPAYRFYIKLGAMKPENAFSGETIPPNITRDEQLIEEIIQASRKNYGSVYIKPKPKKQETKTNNPIKQKTNGKKHTEKPMTNGETPGFPELKKPAVLHVPLMQKNGKFEPRN